MIEFALFSALIVAAIVVTRWWIETRSRGLALSRLNSSEVTEKEPAATRPEFRPAMRRHRWFAWCIGGITIVLLLAFVPVTAQVSVVAGLMVGMLIDQVETMLSEQRMARIEQQLSEAIDLMVGTLKSGGSLSRALQTALDESRAPLHAELEEVVGRIRFGDDPQSVMEELAQRVPLESFRIFSLALAVHWEVGGSLAPTLATVGKTIRDRIEISRRIRSMTAQSRVSTIAVLLTTYFIGAIMWVNDPGRMRSFLSTSIGQTAVSFAMLLEVIGIVWSNSMSRLRF
ncbi:MAG: type secretion system protein [Planctomycetaceae bacterium]|nr:type secretion system protein [Planctomycetaceae bacterium]